MLDRFCLRKTIKKRRFLTSEKQNSSTGVVHGLRYTLKLTRVRSYEKSCVGTRFFWKKSDTRYICLLLDYSCKYIWTSRVGHHDFLVDLHDFSFVSLFLCTRILCYFTWVLMWLTHEISCDVHEISCDSHVERHDISCVNHMKTHVK